MIALEDIIDRPPILHVGGTTWGISPRLARFLDAQVAPRATTLETGAGLSTIVILRRGVARHIAITPYGDTEFKAIKAYCAEVGIDTEALQEISGSSLDYLPSAALPALDLVLIDGAHAFPVPFVDWCYTVEALAIGGLMIVDDLQLATGRILADFMRADQKWDEVLRDQRFGVYRKLAHPIRDVRDWLAQAYLVESSPVAAVRVIRAGAVRRLLALATRACTEPALIIETLRALRRRTRR